MKIFIFLFCTFLLYFTVLAQNTYLPERIFLYKLTKQKCQDIHDFINSDTTLSTATIEKVLEIFREMVDCLDSAVNKYNSVSANIEKQRLRTVTNLLYEDFIDLVENIGKGENTREKIDNYFKELEKFPANIIDKAGQISVSIIATGDVNSALTGSDKINSVSTGSIGIGLKTTTFELHALISLASSADTIKNGFGTSIINSFNGFRSGYLEYSYKLNFLKGQIFADPELWCFVAVNSGVWQIPKDSNGTIIFLNSQITNLSIDVGFSNVMLNVSTPSNTTQLSLQIGLTSRWILGDIAKEGEIRSIALNSDDRLFLGVDGSFKIVFNNITGIISFPIFFMNRGISGLSGGQVFARIQYQANLFSLF